MITKSLVGKSIVAICGTGFLAMGAIYRYRDISNIKPFARRDISGQAVLVTGATSGIGYGVAKGLAGSGAKIIIASRNRRRGWEVVKELQEAGAVEPLFLDLDLSNRASITHCSEEIREASKGKLSIIINNSGMINPSGDTVFGREKSLVTNHLGPFLLTMLLLPDVLENSSRYPGRIIQVGSRTEIMGKLDLEEMKTSGFTRSFDGENGDDFTGLKAYSDTKLANLLFTRELQRRLEIAGSDVKSICVSPGLVSTGLFTMGLTWKMAFFYPFVRMFTRSGDEGAHSVLYAALAPEVEGGSFIGDGEPVAKQSELSKDSELAKGLWEVSKFMMCPDMELAV